MNNLGGRDFVMGVGKQLPEIKKSCGTLSLFLADYNGVCESANIIRMHPENKKNVMSLVDTLLLCDRATGYNTTALVMAALYGLKITCKGNTNILNDPNWLALLPYADWSYEQIESGELWEHLR